MIQHKWPTKTLILILLFLPLQGSCVNNPSPPKTSDLSAYMEKEMRRMMRKHHLPAFALSIVDDEKILYQDAKGYIDLENLIPATPSSVFKLLSVAKAFTAMEIFREVEEGRIDLNAPLTEYLPEFSIQSRFPENEPITVKSLLAHRSGLPRNGCLACFPEEGDSYTLDKFEKSTAECYMAFPFSYRYHYSNLGYNLLGRIVEQNRNMGFAHYMKIHLLNDLGMESSTFNFDDIENPHYLALGYEYYKRKHYPMFLANINSIPSGNLYSTIGDLSIFLQAFLNNKVFAEDNTVQQMYVDHFSTKEDPETMGLGWKTRKLAGGDLMVWHDGGPDDGSGALIAMVPEQNLGLAMLANSTSFGSDKSVPLAINIFNRLIEEKTNSRPMHAEEPEPISIPTELLNEYEGLYMAWGMPMYVEARKSKLKGKIGGFALDLIPVSETEFQVSHWMDKIGLTKIIKPPIAFDKLRISFPEQDSTDPGFLIINLDNISYEICPRYPDQRSPEESWMHLLGSYELAGRLPGNKAGELWGNKYNIYLEDSVLKLSGVFGPIIPQDDNFIRIVSGPFAGETMEYFPDSGHLIHQNAVFVPYSEL